MTVLLCDYIARFFNYRVLLPVYLYARISWRRGMKRLSIILAVFLLLLSGCSSQKEAEFNVVESTYAPAATEAVDEPTEAPKDELTAEGDVYTIAWLTDTQHYSKRFPDTYLTMTEFIADNAERMNLEYIAHTGDLVHDFDDETQWLLADKAMKSIDALPNGVLAGNHDMDNEGEAALYEKYFGEHRYNSRGWYGGSFENNMGHYDLVNAGGTRYIFVYLSFEPTEDAIKWANKVFAEHRDRVGVLAVHEYFDTDSTLTEEGQKLFDKVVAKNPNIYMVLCGHRYTVNCIEAAFDDDGDGTPERTVYQMIANYQAAGDMGGDGYMRFMQVDEAEDVIRMYTYSPVKKDFMYFDEAEHAAEKYAADPANEEFVVPIPWR